jgi:hypothetical protein
MAPDQFAKSRHAASQRRVIALALVWMALVTLSVMQVGGSAKAERGSVRRRLEAAAAVAAVATPPARQLSIRRWGLCNSSMLINCPTLYPHRAGPPA